MNNNRNSSSSWRYTPKIDPEGRKHSKWESHSQN